IKHGIRTFILGGEIKSTTYATVGASALETLKSYRFDKVFLGMNGIDIKYGLTTPDEQEAIIKKYAIHLGTNAYILADHDKYDNVYFDQIKYKRLCLNIF